MKTTKSGFTVMELSIVMTVLGLIFYAVLSGQDLIDSAKIQQQIAQIKDVETAYNSFYTKYGGLPGDIFHSKAVKMGLSNSGAFAGAFGHGNGNGWITSAHAYQIPQHPPGEGVGFWLHFYESGLMTLECFAHEGGDDINHGMVGGLARGG
ncbi:MAG: prepilin-type N-terminal cleavage/methylation domain-containing protein, partial [Pseudomonadota bacterium]